MKHLTARPDVSMLRRAVPDDRGQGAGQGPQRSGRPGSTTCCRPRTRRGSRRSGSSATARPAAARSAGRPAGPPEEDVLRIEAEEPVFYIGPETRPPRRQGLTLRAAAAGTCARHADAAREARSRRSRKADAEQARVRGAAIPASGRAGLQPRPQAASAPPRRGRPVRRAVAPLPAPRPRRPSRRLAQRPGPIRRAGQPRCSGPPRCWPCWPSPPPPRWRSTRRSDPQQVAYLYGMALLGTWTALIPDKALETRRLDRGSRRLIAAGGRAGSPASPGSTLARLLRLEPDPAARVLRQPRRLMPPYFAALYAIMAGWSSLTARDRQSRFRLRPVALDRPAVGGAHPALAVPAAGRHRHRRHDRHRRPDRQPLERGGRGVCAIRQGHQEAEGAAARGVRVNQGRLGASIGGEAPPSMAQDSFSTQGRWPPRGTGLRR